LSGHINRILISETAILEQVQKLGRQISEDYRDRELIIICVLKGAVVFLADLIRTIEIPTIIDFIQVSSYGDDIESSGIISLFKNLTTDIQGRDILVVDDIIDSGLTLEYLLENLKAKNPASIKLCVLLEKIKSRESDIKVDYVGFQIPDEFVIGYGLDHAGKYRGLRYIAVLKN
jgi:hypoxanthine phosphoribosyltransferase